MFTKAKDPRIEQPSLSTLPKAPIPAPHHRLLLTVPEAAEEIRMSEGYIKAAIRSGALRSGKFGRSRRILSDDLRAWAERIIVGTVVVQGQASADSSQNQVIEKTVGVRS